MADYGAIADAIAARFLGTTPPTGQPAIRLSTADLPNGITATPTFLVFEPDDQWTDQTASGRSGTLTFKCRLILGQQDEPRTVRAALDWRTALYQRLDAHVDLGGVAGVASAVVTQTAQGTLTYGGADWPSVEVTVVVSIREAVNYAA